MAKSHHLLLMLVHSSKHLDSNPTDHGLSISQVYRDHPPSLTVLEPITTLNIVRV